jgi:uncharacterized protein YegL
MNDSKQPVRITLLLDRTGSMQECKAETIQGLNAWLDRMRKDTAQFGDALVTALQFDSQAIETLFTDKKPEDIADWTDETFVPRAWTNLYDAIAHGIRVCPGKCLFNIMTDGQENSSHEWNKTMVKQLIEEKQREGWTFVYLGANQDAFGEASAIGIPTRNTANYRPQNVAAASAVFGTATSSYRSTGGAQSDTVIADVANLTGKSEEELRKSLTE